MPAYQGPHFALQFERGVPPLDHDVMMLERFGDRYATIHKSGKIERRIVWNLIGRLKKHGWECRVAFDGECSYTAAADGTVTEDTENNVWERGKPALTREQAMNIAFNLDEVSLRFGKGSSDTLHGVFIVLGNGVDCIADWNYSDGDPDGFDAILNAFTDNIERFA